MKACGLPDSPWTWRSTGSSPTACHRDSHRRSFCFGPIFAALFFGASSADNFFSSLANPKEFDSACATSAAYLTPRRPLLVSVTRVFLRAQLL